MLSVATSTSEQVIDLKRHKVKGIKSFMLSPVLLVGISRLYLSVELSQMRLALKSGDFTKIN